MENYCDTEDVEINALTIAQPLDLNIGKLSETSLSKVFPIHPLTG